MSTICILAAASALAGCATHSNDIAAAYVSPIQYQGALGETALAPGPPGPTTIVSMLQDGGTFVVPVTINGQITLNFVVDSGAADVSIPADVVITLVGTGTITSDDILGKRTYTLADGSILRSEQFIIRSLKIGDRTVENVTGSVAPVAGGLLLGQSFLGRFHSWSIDNQKEELVLN
jgi:clan AA aspartic protease (TIGR02281 family)